MDLEPLTNPAQREYNTTFYFKTKVLPEDTICQQHRHMVYTHDKQHEGLAHLIRCPDESLKQHSAGNIYCVSCT